MDDLGGTIIFGNTHIFGDSYGSGMGIVWVPLTIRGSHYWGVPDNPIEIEIGGFLRTPRCYEKDAKSLSNWMKF